MVRSAQQSGAMGEFMAAAALSRRGCHVSVPHTDPPYDLVVDVDGLLLRCQVKMTTVNRVDLRGGGHVKRAYEPGDFDYYIIVCALPDESDNMQYGLMMVPHDRRRIYWNISPERIIKYSLDAVVKGIRDGSG